MNPEYKISKRFTIDCDRMAQKKGHTDRSSRP